MLLDVLQTCKQCLTVFGSRYYDFFLIINNQRRLPHGFLWLVNDNYAATRYQGPIQKFAEGLRFLSGFVLTRYIQEQLPSFFNKTFLYSYSYSIELLLIGRYKVISLLPKWSRSTNWNWGYLLSRHSNRQPQKWMSLRELIVAAVAIAIIRHCSHVCVLRVRARCCRHHLALTWHRAGCCVKEGGIFSYNNYTRLTPGLDKQLITHLLSTSRDWTSSNLWCYASCWWYSDLVRVASCNIISKECRM